MKLWIGPRDDEISIKRALERDLKPLTWFVLPDPHCQL